MNIRTNQIKNISRTLPIWVTLGLFLLGVVFWASAALGGFPGWATRSLDLISAFTTTFLGIFIEAAPFLLLGTLASGIVEVFISKEELASMMPRQVVLGALVGSLMGLFFPVCECGVVPLTRRLFQKGLPLPVGIAFLLAAPVLNPIVIASTLTAFGFGVIFWARLGMTLIIAVSTGIIFSFQGDLGQILREKLVASEIDVAPILTDILPEKPRLAQRIQRVLHITADEFFEMGRFLVLGALLASALQTIVPQSALTLLSHGPVLPVLIMAGLAVILSICSTVDAFVALAFAATFTPGAVTAFLVYGPMVDIKTTMMYLQVFKRKTVIYLILLPLVLTVAGSVAINYLGLY